MQRLTRVTHSDGTTIDYVYDALGNRLMKTTTLPGAPSNQPPAAVTNPSIANGTTNVALTPTLSWSPATDPNPGDAVVYYLYLGTSPSPPLVWSGWGHQLGTFNPVARTHNLLLVFGGAGQPQRANRQPCLELHHNLCSSRR